MVQALIMIVFLAIIATFVLHLAFGRHIMVSRANASDCRVLIDIED